MINGESILAVIPARGGSKGVPRKNIRYIGGKPLIAWTIEAAKSSRYLDQVILSTDDLEIANIAREYHCDVPFIRDPLLGCDNTSSIDVVIDAINRCEGFDWVMLLQPTSPLRTNVDIENAIELCHEKLASSCVSVSRVNHSPYWMYTLNDDVSMSPLLPNVSGNRRQDMPPVYSLNGAIYMARVQWLLENKKFVTEKTVAYTMPFERSFDLDTEQDFCQLQIILGD